MGGAVTAEQRRLRNEAMCEVARCAGEALTRKRLARLLRKEFFAEMRQFRLPKPRSKVVTVIQLDGEAMQAMFRYLEVYNRRWNLLFPGNQGRTLIGTHVRRILAPKEESKSMS